jgi:prepilin-type N-terminal cleavage/methylation domain-containing protein
MLLRELNNLKPSSPLRRRHTRLAQSKARGGFSLLELLLVVVLVSLLMAAMVFNFTTLARGHQLQEGTNRLETLMRFARAQAANSGRKVQLVFGAETNSVPAATTGEVRATWEPDPLGKPGCYAQLAEAQFHVQELNDLVQVESVKILDGRVECPTAEDAEGQLFDEELDLPPAKPMSPITFYPDGSSDSAEIIVAARSPEEDQRMSVRLVGMTGSISHQLLTAYLDDTFGEAGISERFGVTRREGLVRDPGAEPRESTSRLLNTRPTATSSRSVSTPSRATVGETNSVDHSD